MAKPSLLDFSPELKEWWHDNGMWVIIISSILFVIIASLIRYFWSEEYENDVPIFDFFFGGRTIKKSKRKIIRESKGELICKNAAIKIFNKPFIKVRPKFLLNPRTGKPLELDIYNEELNLAIEYNGRQHYEYIPYFHRSYEDFLEQKYRDDLKRNLCKQNNIILIEVPYTVNFDNIEKFITTKSKELNLL